MSASVRKSRCWVPAEFRTMRPVSAARIVAREYEALTRATAPIDVPAGAQGAPPGPAVDYRFERIAALGYEPEGDLRAETRNTLRLLGVGQ